MSPQYCSPQNKYFGYLKIESKFLGKIQIRTPSELQLEENKEKISMKDKIHSRALKEFFYDNGVYKVYKKDVIKIGRSSLRNNIIIHNNTFVSAQHCLIWPIQFDENSCPIFYLKDTSLNGVYVNKKLVGKGNIIILKDNDFLEIKNGLKATFKSRIFEDNTVSKPLISIQNNTVHVSDNWYTQNSILGNGTFGKVYVGCSTTNSSPKYCAVKVIKCKNFKVQIREAELLKNLDHVNIIKLYESHYEDDNIYIFEELVCGGDLFSYLSRGDTLQALPEPQCMLFMYQILQGVGYLHDHGIVHRDLKLDNILLDFPDVNARLIIADFGTACKFNRNSERLKTVVGTSEYSAPEVGLAAQYDYEMLGYTNKCDMWAIGIILHIMISGISPFYANGDEKSMVLAAKECKLNFKQSCWKTISADVIDFLQHLIQLDEELRYDCEDCCDHPWLFPFLDILHDLARSRFVTRD